MKPDQISADMNLALERIIFKEVRDRSPFVASLYPSPAATLRHPDTQPILAQLPFDIDDKVEFSLAVDVLMVIADTFGLSEDVAKDHVLNVCHQILAEDHFPFGYLGENPERLRSELIKLGYVCYLVGFEAGSVEQCGMFGEIIDTSVDRLAACAMSDTLTHIEKATNKIMAATYFTQMMMIGAQASEFQR
ncbi:hypothetical protein KBC70_00560 [Candidatus Woesebacteria bacterium]|jgi:hypothetical protein|nr:hypothetical protein [Candidatus Woesebacteria bacterium]